MAAAGPLTQAGMVTVRLGDLTRAPAPKEQKAPAALPVAYVAEAQAAPQINGRLTDPAWTRATALRLACTLDGAAAAAQPTEVRLLRDAQHMYVAWRCAEPLIDHLVAMGREHDGNVWEDDSVEVFLGSGDRYYHFAANAVGSTYDARERDRGWNSGFRAAAGRGKDAWTAEMAIPLAPLAAGKALPKELAANFYRTRRATGNAEESAWSPTGSGDSHVPARFGKLVLSDAAASAQAETSETREAKKDAVEILPAEGGQGVVRFDLSSMPKAAKVYRADLLLLRTAPLDGRADDSRTDPEVHPLTSELAAGGRPEVSGRALALCGPWFDRFDATAAVQAWVSGKTNGGFLVRGCPSWNAAATCLDIAYEGKPEKVPPQAKGLKVLHRAGQTFITWQEVDPLITAPETTWGEIKRVLAQPQNAVSYRLYAHTRRIDADNLHQAQRLAEVGPLSGYNVNARNPEYLIGQAMIEPDEMGELAKDYNGYMHTWQMDHPRMDRYPVRRFAIDEAAGPLPVGTGLYVHHPAAAGRQYYAVVSCRRGVENTREFSEANALAGPVDEAVGTGAAVRQGPGLRGPYFDWPGTRWVYVQWCAPPLAPRPNMYFNWSVLIPPQVQGRVPAELYFHPAGYSYAQPGKKMLLGSLQIAPHDYPASGWFGFNGAWGTLKSFNGQAVANHTQRRILAFLEWAKKELPIDADRILAVGADGAAAMAINFPDTFAYVLVTGFDGAALNPKASGDFTAAWGPRSADIKDDRGRGDWGWAMLDDLVAADPGKDLPLFVCRGGSWGRDEGWGKGRGRLYRSLHAAGQPLVAHWAWGGELPRPNKYDGLWRGLDITRASPIPAFANSSLDQEGEGGGQANMAYGWKDANDSADGFEVTIVGRESQFDLTPRRLRHFKAKPGEPLHWETTSLPGRRNEKAEVLSGDVAADARGIVTLRGLKIPRGAEGLKVRIFR
jgi:hypothetical protein